MKEMKSIKFGTNSDTYEVVDAQARTDISNIPSTYATKAEVTSGLAGKQATLVSGVNIKTINNKSLLGSGNITIEGGSGGGGGSEIHVIEPTPITTTQKSWSQILEQAFQSAEIYGLQVTDNGTIASLVTGNTGSWTISNGSISITADAEKDSFSVTVGSVTEELYKSGGWVTKTVKDDTIDTVVINDGNMIQFYTKNGDGVLTSTFVRFNTTTAASIKKLSANVTFSNADYVYHPCLELINYANILYKAISLDATFENNIINNQSYMLGNYDIGGLSVSSDSASSIYDQKDASFYASGSWEGSRTLWNGCTWDVATHTVTYPKAIKISVNSEDTINAIPDTLTFTVQSGGEILLPDPADYTNQLAEINDVVDGVKVLIFSTGTEWRFASDVLQLTKSQYESARSSKSLYGISVGDKFYLDPTRGLPIKMSEGGDWWQPYDFQASHSSYNVTGSSLSLSSFSTTNHILTADSQNTTVDLQGELFDCVLNVDVADIVPTYTFNADKPILYKQDGTKVQALTFNANTIYNITFTVANFAHWDPNLQQVTGPKYLLVDCKSFPKTVGE